MRPHRRQVRAPADWEHWVRRSHEAMLPRTDLVTVCFQTDSPQLDCGVVHLKSRFSLVQLHVEWQCL
eukprot:699001-Amphidinium_carterae.1